LKIKFLSFFSLFVVFILLFSSASLGQGSPDTITRPGSIADSGLYDYWGDMSGQGRAGSVLLGKLAVEGEPLPWDPILISVLCKGQMLQTAQTDALGRFVIPATKSFCQPASACSLTHPEPLPLEGCTVQASVPGFGSNAITITERNLRDDPNLGTLTMFRKEARGSGTAVSNTSSAASPDAIASFEKARKEFVGKKMDKAEGDLEKAVQIDPQFADAWFQLGNLEQETDRTKARDYYAKALGADPKFVLPYEQLAFMDAQEGKWQEVVDDTNHQLQLDPRGTLQTWYYNAVANLQLKKMDEAQNSAQKSVALDPQHTIPGAERIIAVVLAKKGDYPGALEHLRKCFAYTPKGPEADLLKKQIAFLQSKTSANR
jgi:tetratricopeptide (TPR) repeat protein